MKLFIILGLVVVSHANLLDTLNGVVHTAGHALEGAGNTVLHGLTDAGQVVGGAFVDAGQTLGSTFGDVWNVVKDPLAQVGQQVLINAAEFAATQGVEMALASLAAGKRDLPQKVSVQGYLLDEVMDEYKKWLATTEAEIKDSKQEMLTAFSTHGFAGLSKEMQSYINQYAEAVKNQAPASFVHQQAQQAMTNALQKLPQLLNDRLHQAIAKMQSQA